VATIILARHGQTDWNAERRWQGHADEPLNEAGRAEAQRLGAALRGHGVTRIVSSDLARASDTAAIAGAILGVPVELDARLREVDVGEWSGLTLAEVEKRYPEGLARRRAGGTGWAEGEPFEVMAARVVEALTDIAERYPDEQVLVVSHGGCLRAASVACRVASEEWISAGNCDYDVVAVEAGEMRRLDSTRGGLHQLVQGSGSDAG
jgi:probable phosphoglycerate mutase